MLCSLEKRCRPVSPDAYHNTGVPTAEFHIQRYAVYSCHNGGGIQ